MAIFVVLWSCLLTTKLSCLQKNNFGHTKVLPQCQLQSGETRGIHPSYVQSNVSKGMAQTWGSWLNQWTNMDYFLITGPCTLSSMWSIIRAWRGFCIDFFFRQNSNHFCMSGRQQYARGGQPRAAAGSRGQGGQGSSRAGTGIDPPKGILIVLKKGCDWTKKCMAVYHQYIDISDNFLCCAMYKYAGIMSRQISVFVQLSIYQMFFQLK